LSISVGDEGIETTDLVSAKDSKFSWSSGTTPLREAAKNGHKDVAELLRQHGGHE
jgi:ankyrin repeat protein